MTSDIEFHLRAVHALLFLGFLFVCLLVCLFCIFRAAPTAYEGSQAGGLIGATQLLAYTTATATPDP